MDLTDINQIKSLLVRHRMWARKGLGQHFLIDKSALGSIVDSAELGPADFVLEIGPGLGVLTQFLVSRAGQVEAVEFDPKMIEVLKETVPAENLKVVQEHVLKFNLGGLPKGYKVVANLPYYITSPILRNFLEAASNKPKEMVLLIQKEVAERIVAKPGEMSVLAVAVQLFGEPEIITEVPKGSFWPPPKVDSAVIRVKVFEKPRYPVEEKDFFRLVKAGFGEKRKKLANSLSGGLRLPKEEVIKYLEESGLKDNARAEELSLGDWYNLYKSIIGEKS